MRRGSRREDARRGPRITDLADAPAAILAAGGAGRRVGSDTPKQFLEVAGRPILGWSFDAIQAGGIGTIVVVVPPDRVAEAERLLPGAADVVAGGDTRQASVRNGLAAVDAKLVVVHDAARPFAPPAVFGAVLDALSDSDAVVPGLQMKETVKVVRGGAVVETLEREEVWNIQTPQGFKTAVLREAHRKAEVDGFTGTDDAQLVERYGGRVRVVAGDPLAFKITDVDDVRRAEAVAMQARR